MGGRTLPPTRRRAPERPSVADPSVTPVDRALRLAGWRYAPERDLIICVGCGRPIHQCVHVKNSPPF